MKILLWLCVLAVPPCFALPADPLTTVLSRKSCTPPYILLGCTGSAYRLTEDTAHTSKENIVVRVPSFLSTGLATHPSGHLQRRDRRTKCGPAQRPINARSLSEGVTKHDGLSIRVMKLPGSTREQVNIFMLGEIKTAESVVHDDTVSTATYYRFGNEAMSLAVSGLCGCTTLVIVSRTAVYFGHYYENLSFNPDDDVPYARDPQAAFQNTVLNGLRSGIPNAHSGVPDQDSLTAHAADFQGGRAFLIVPLLGPDDERNPYKDQWNQMQTTIRGIIPGGVNIQVVPYNALDKEDTLLLTSSRGMVLFKYDPAHQANNPTRLAKLWSETTELHTDAW